MMSELESEFYALLHDRSRLDKRIDHLSRVLLGERLVQWFDEDNLVVVAKAEPGGSAELSAILDGGAFELWCGPHSDAWGEVVKESEGFMQLSPAHCDVVDVDGVCWFVIPTWPSDLNVGRQFALDAVEHAKGAL